MSTYRIKDWDKHFETSETRKYVRLGWVPVPNKHDGFGYRTLIGMPNGFSLYAAWVLILQVASKKKKPRGLLTDDSGTPLSPMHLAVKTGAPMSAFEAAIPALMQIGWIEEVTENLPEHQQNLPESPGIPVTNRIELNRITTTTTDPAPRPVKTIPPIPLKDIKSVNISNDPKPSVTPAPELPKRVPWKYHSVHDCVFNFMLTSRDKRGLGMDRKDAAKATRAIKGAKSNGQANDWTPFTLGALLYAYGQDPLPDDPIVYAKACINGKSGAREEFERYEKRAAELLRSFEIRVAKDTGAENVEVQENSEVEP